MNLKCNSIDVAIDEEIVSVQVQPEGSTDAIVYTAPKSALALRHVQADTFENLGLVVIDQDPSGISIRRFDAQIFSAH